MQFRRRHHDPYSLTNLIGYIITTHLSKRLSGLLHEADAQLFRKVVNNKEHCIHQLLPPEKILPMKLRASNCIFALPRCQFNLYKRSFVLRSLFEDAY